MMMLSDICLSDVCVVYIGPKSRTERPRTTKISTEVAHITRDLDTTFKVKVTGARAYCGGLHSLLLCYDDRFEGKLPEIFKDIHESYEQIEARLKAEQFKVHCCDFLPALLVKS